MTRVLVAALAAVSLLQLAACKRAEPEAKPSTTAKDTTSETLATAIAGAPGLSTFAAGLKDIGLSGALDGAAPYTLFAPDDDAFGKLGKPGAALRQPEQRAVMAEIIRDHTVPGYLTPRDIEASIKAHQGKPVVMRTVGDGQLTFASKGGQLTIASADGVTAQVAGEPVRASNGAAIPIDTVLRKLPAG